MKYNLKFIILFLLFSTLFANDNLKKVSLQLQWKHQFEFAGFYIAKEKGYYKDAGLDVELKEFDSHINITDDVVDGKTTFGINYSNVIYERANGKDVVILNAILQSSPHVLLSLESSGINSVKDFRDKTIMSSEDALTSAPFISMLQKNRLSFDDLKQIPHTFNIDDIVEGKADLVNVFTSNEPFMLKQKGIKYKIWDPKDYGFDFYDVILFTSEKVLEEDPEMVEAFNEASLKGWKYAFNNIDETADIILKKYNTQNKTKEALIYEANNLKELAYYNTNNLGEIDPNKIQRIFDIYNLLGYAKKNLDLEQFIYRKNNILLTKKEKEYLQSLQALRVFAIDNNKPLSYIENGNPTGYANELFKLVAKKLNLQIKWIDKMSYGESLEALKNDEIDISSLYSHFRTSREFVTSSSPIVSIPFTIVGRFDSDPIKSVNDLKGKRLVLVKGYQQTLTIEQDFPDIEFKTVDNIKEAYQLVRSLEADYYIDQAIHSSYYIRENFLSDLKIVTELSQKEIGKLNLHFGIRSSMPLLQSSIQKTLNSIDNKEINKLKEKWLISTRQEQLILSKKEKEYLSNKKSVTMCIDPSWMPFEAVDNNGKHIGISSDYFKYFNEVLPTEFNVVQTKSWSQSLEYAKNRRCDILSLAMETPKRKEYMNFTSSYLKVPLVIATKLDVPFIDNLRLIENKTVAIPKGYAFIEILKKKYQNINITEVDNIEEGLNKVNKGEVFGYVGTLPGVGYKFQTQYNGELKIAGKFDEQWELGVGVRNDDSILLNIMQKAVNSITHEQQQTILNHWISIKYEKGIDYSIVWKTIIISLIIMFIFIYWNRKIATANRLLNEVKLELEEKNKQLERSMQQTKMAALGEMIGNIAHQWRQPLSVISMTSSGMQLLKDVDELSDKEFDRACKSIDNNVLYLSKTIDTFKDYIKGDNKKTIFNLSNEIDSLLSLVKGVIKNNDIQLILLTDETVEINGYKNELVQALVNIFNNAKDALVINCTKDKYIFITTYMEKNNAVIKIKDNAGGIPLEIIEKVYEPYFTTKHQSQGTGLGLYMSHQLIVDSMKGNIFVDNVKFEYQGKTYEGAEFTVKLPLN